MLIQFKGACDTNKVDIVLFQLETCDKCDVTLAIIQSYAGIINGTMEGNPITTKRYSLAEEEGAAAAARMGVTTTPTIFINGERHEGRMTGDEILDAITSKLGLPPERIAELRREIFG